MKVKRIDMTETRREEEEEQQDIERRDSECSRNQVPPPIS
jgi:hypothetical protein